MTSKSTRNHRSAVSLTAPDSPLTALGPISPADLPHLDPNSKRSQAYDNDLATLTGVIVHQVLAELAPKSISPAASQISLAVSRRTVSLAQTRPMRRAVNVAAFTAVVSYFGAFRWPVYEFAGAEVHLEPDDRADLVWLLPGGRYLIDEIKVTSSSQLDGAVLAQVQRYLDAGIRIWGPAFAGVRVCHVRSPLSSALLTPDGRVLPVGRHSLNGCSGHWGRA